MIDPGTAAPAEPSEDSVTTRPIKWEGMPLSLPERLRKQVLPSLAIIAVFAAIVILESGSSGSHTSAGQAPHGASIVATPTQAHTAAGVAKPGDPTVASCAAAWNAGRSPTHRHILDLRVEHDLPPFAVIATYTGPPARLARLGGGSQVLVAPRACIVIARHYVFVQQSSADWGLVRARPGYPFVTIARTHGWTPTHANVTVKVGPLRSGSADIGALAQRNQQLVMLTVEDLGSR